MKHLETIIAWICLTIIAVFLMYSCNGRMRGIARADAYPAAFWASLPDYQERVLTVPGMEQGRCSEGVASLGGERYRVPVGVSQFRCEGGSN